jgi:hypothetical protein
MIALIGFDSFERGKMVTSEDSGGALAAAGASLSHIRGEHHADETCTQL